MGSTPAASRSARSSAPTSAAAATVEALTAASGSATRACPSAPAAAETRAALGLQRIPPRASWSESVAGGSSLGLDLRAQAKSLPKQWCQREGSPLLRQLLGPS